MPNRRAFWVRFGPNRSGSLTHFANRLSRGDAEWVRQWDVVSWRGRPSNVVANSATTAPGGGVMCGRGDSD